MTSETKTYTLILVRHGQSSFNVSSQFAGWIDAPLSTIGVNEAINAGRLIGQYDLKPDKVYTSRLSRTIKTANIILSEIDRLWIDVSRSWRLNERHYGVLQGKKKNEVLQQYGLEKFKKWRRNYNYPPPALEEGKDSSISDERYKDIEKLEGVKLPRSESLKQVIDRLVPFFNSSIVPDLKSGKSVLVVCHGTSLRALIKYLSNISSEDIENINIPTAIPLVYKLTEDENGDLKPIQERFYLDEEAAKRGAEKVAAQGMPEPQDTRAFL
ncbi:phosphoglycerate mutase [Nadsonia fulvescens var. elongata DSM 6958]|uniref:Phosphoglycerate mutase n=1 Tax=Nadsonia fulvescens var. elongata DSM 6958 TaxID=857566 RepID=A0A1E3PSC6_9ASCO|nr:phosphoglycerate mutase [Nadsonia fulvescens var. elongata DSM 6958]